GSGSEPARASVRDVRQHELLELRRLHVATRDRHPRQASARNDLLDVRQLPLHVRAQGWRGRTGIRDDGNIRVGDRGLDLTDELLEPGLEALLAIVEGTRERMTPRAVPPRKRRLH